MNRLTDNRTLINKFLAGEIQDGDIDILEAWLASDRENRRIFDEENEIWQQSQIKIQEEYFRTDDAWSQISASLNLDKKSTSQVSIFKKSSVRILIAAASVFCLIGLGGTVLWLTQKKTQEIPVASSMVKTLEGEKSRIILYDSTVVYMNSASSLEYSSDYNKTDRIVKLTGEAFFDVHTDPEKPFKVMVDNMTVTAKGTRFNVSAYSNDNQIEATLEKGMIEVSVSGKEPIDLNAGQQIIYNHKSDKLLLRDVSTETYTSWKENKLRFMDTSFEEVLRKISRRYNVIFEVRNRDLLELKFTATFIDESIEDVMNMLEKVSPINYRIIKRTTVNDRNYLKPKIIVEKKKNFTGQK